MSTFEYTHHKAANSSAISELFYNSRSSELIVETHNGAQAGYYDVPQEVFDAMVIENDSPTGSLGRYWNMYIKPNFRGFDTSFISQFRAIVTDESFPEDDESGPEFGVDPGSAPAAPEDEEFSVEFSRDGADYAEVTILAVNPYTALDKLNAIANLAGWKNVRVFTLSREA